jgi:hypothetical protein
MPHKEAIGSLLSLRLPNLKNDLKSKITELEFQNEMLRKENASLKDKAD